MFNQDFLKKLTVLFVEDDQSLRESLQIVLVKIFKEAIVCENGQEGLDKVIEYKDQNKTIDIIISDINMPLMNGIDFLKNIREFDKEIPFIFVTAHTEYSFTMEAIKYGVSHYIIKPVNTQQLLLQIQEICEVKYNQKLIEQTKIELERYVDIVNQVAIISKTDPKGIITYVNDIFCDVSKYTRDELIGQNQNIIRHQDMPYFMYEELWSDIKEGKTWKGKLKNKAKDDEPYFINSSIFPLYDDLGENIIEYVGVGFLTTQDEVEKRELKKRVSEHYRESKRKDIVSRTMINNLKNELAEAKIQLKKLDNIDIIMKSFEMEREKNKKLIKQINYYESEIKEHKQKYEDVINTVTRNKNLWVEKKNESEVKVKELTKKVEKQRDIIKAKDYDIQIATRKNDTHEKSINELVKIIKQIDKSKLPYDYIKKKK
jgi:PAS domain S-box-containing protein